MKRLVMLAALVCVALSGFASAAQESVAPTYTPEKPLVLFAASATPFTGAWVDNVFKPLIDKSLVDVVREEKQADGTVRMLTERKPTLAVRTLPLDISDGKTTAQTAYLASGIRFLLLDYGGRLGELMVEEYALDLSPYVDVEDFYPGQRALVSPGGRFSAIPLPGNAETFMVNKTLLDSVGYTVPDNWTTDDFLAMCAAVKAKRPDAIPFNWYVGELNADYYFMHLLAWFGAEVYANGDYTRTSINSPQTIRAMEYAKLLYDRGYLPDNVLTRKAGEYLQDQYHGRAAAFATFITFTPGQIDSLVTAGSIERWQWQVVPFPRGPGVARPKNFVMQHGIVAPRSDYMVPGTTYRKPKDQLWDDAYGELAVGIMREHLRNAQITGVSPVAKSQEGYFQPDLAKFPDYLVSQPTLGEAWDLGLFTRTYSAARFKAFPEFQDVLAGRKTPAEAAASLERELNVVLARNARQ